MVTWKKFCYVVFSAFFLIVSYGNTASAFYRLQPHSIKNNRIYNQQEEKWLIDFIVSSDDNIVYALNKHSSAKSVLYVNDAKSGALLKAIPVDWAVYDLTLTPDNKKLFVAAFSKIYSIDLSTGIMGTIPTNRENWIGPLKVTHEGKTLYASDAASSNPNGKTFIYLIDADSNNIKSIIPKLTNARDGFQTLVFNADESKIYLSEVAMSPYKDLAEIDTKTSQLTERFMQADNRLDPQDMIFDSQKNLLYVTSYNNKKVYILDPVSKKVINRIGVGKDPMHCALTNDGKKLYVSNRGDNTVSIINLALGKVIKTLTVGNKPQSIRVSKDGKKIYVANANDFSISVIDSRTDEIIKTIALQTT